MAAKLSADPTIMPSNFPSLAHGPDPSPNAGRGRASPEGSLALGVV